MILKFNDRIQLFNGKVLGYDLNTQILPSLSPTPTPTNTPTNTITPSITPSLTPTNTRTPTITPTNTRTPTITPTNTRTPTITPTNTRTPTITPTITPTNTRTPTLTPTSSKTPTPTPTVTTSPFVTLYSNLNLYIIGGVRQAVTADLVRSNISTSRRLVVTETIVINGFKFVRIPPDNWSSIGGYAVTGTLSVVAGTGASIDGGLSSKSFNTKSTINIPSDSASRANTTSQYDIYDVRPVNNSTTTLTAGQYNISLLGTAANMDIATLTTSLFPIDTSKTIYPSTTASTTQFAMEVF